MKIQIDTAAETITIDEIVFSLDWLKSYKPNPDYFYQADSSFNGVTVVRNWHKSLVEIKEANDTKRV